MNAVMPEMTTLLDNVSHHDVIWEPFPHIIIENPVPDDLCHQLLSRLPKINDFPQLKGRGGGKWEGNNKRLSFPQIDVQKSEDVDLLWKSCLASNTSDRFIAKFLDLFGKGIVDVFPDFETRFKPINQLQHGRYRKDVGKDLYWEAQISVNTPAKEKASSVAPAHLDGPEKLFWGLWYLRIPGDTTPGGDLVVYRSKERLNRYIPGRHGRYIDLTSVEPIKTISYKSKKTISNYCKSG